MTERSCSYYNLATSDPPKEHKTKAQKPTWFKEINERRQRIWKWENYKGLKKLEKEKRH